MKFSRHQIFLILFLSFFSTACAQKNQSFAELAIPLPQRKSLAARYYKSSKPGPVVVALHGLGSSQDEWSRMAEFLLSEEISVITFDARGHGKSSQTRDEQGTPNEHQSFTEVGPYSQWDKMIGDVGHVLTYAEKELKIDRSQTVLIGASLGANVALVYSYLTWGIPKVILLSPGIEYAGIKTREAVHEKKGRTIFIVSHPSDTYAYQSAQELKKISPPIVFWTATKSGHGVGMVDKDLLSKIKQWIHLE